MKLINSIRPVTGFVIIKHLKRIKRRLSVTLPPFIEGDAHPHPFSATKDEEEQPLMNLIPLRRPAISLSMPLPSPQQQPGQSPANFQPAFTTSSSRPSAPAPSRKTFAHLRLQSVAEITMDLSKSHSHGVRFAPRPMPTSRNLPQPPESAKPCSIQEVLLSPNWNHL